MPETILLVGSPTYDQVSSGTSVGHDSKVPCIDKFFFDLDKDCTDSSGIAAVDQVMSFGRAPGAVTGTPHKATHPGTSEDGTPFDRPAWRVLKPWQGHLATGLSQQSWLRAPLTYASFFWAKGSGGRSSSSDGFDVPRPGLARPEQMHGSIFRGPEATKLGEAQKRRVDAYGSCSHTQVVTSSVADTRGDEGVDGDEDDFLNQSIALHEDVDSSQVNLEASSQGGKEEKFLAESANALPSPELLKAGNSLSTYSNTASSSTSDSSSPKIPHHSKFPSLAQTLPKRTRMPSFDATLLKMQPPQSLNTLPNAQFLQNKIPQTLTATLVVGIISISPPRTIIPKRTGRPVELIETLVGDETAAGFAISFWVNPQNDKGEDALKGELEGLRTGDVVLIQCLALAHFRGKAYGQSIGRRSGKEQKRRRSWRTQATLLFRSGLIDCAEETGPSGRNYTPLDGPGESDQRHLQKGVFHEDEGDDQLVDLVSKRASAVNAWVRCFVDTGTLERARDRRRDSGPHAALRHWKGSRNGLAESVDGLPPDDTPAG